ncbi:MAG: manganese efflux pump [Clostridia bacterium]|nr:manganese efflux pump [Clostridia bacterium]
MHVFELILISIGLSADAFAVAVCKGLSVRKTKFRHYLITGAWFGGSQALMPLIGYFVGSLFAGYIESIDHWVAFVLLSFLGVKMIIEGASKKEESVDDSFAFFPMLVLAVATSIDALMSGVAFAMLEGVNIFVTVAAIGGITFALSAVGLKIGNVFGARFRSAAEIAGGIILILIGVKILLQHLGVIAF